MREVILFSQVDEAKLGHGEDRVAIRTLGNRTLIVVADGAGGVSGGAAAADTVCTALDACANTTPERWLARLDREMDATGRSGLAAVVVISLSNNGEVFGASVGDCEAWIFGQGEPVNLTARQARKPLLGSGRAEPVGFHAHLSSGTLVAGTDGLWKYADLAKLAEMAHPLDTAPAKLIDAVRLRGGALQDDVALVVCALKGA